MKLHPSIRPAAIVPVLAAVCSCVTPAPAAPLWQIGEPDDSTAGLALAPDGYRRFGAPAFFVVGRSDPARDWPYVQPGPADGSWSGGKPQTFEVLFGLAAAPTGPARLVLDLADTHAAHPPTLRVEVNGHPSEHATPAGGGDASINGRPEAGRGHVVVVDVPAGHLQAGDNHIAVTTANGSWVLWDSLRLEGGEELKLAPVGSNTRLVALRSGPAVFRHEGGERQAVEVEVIHVGPPVRAELRVGGHATPVELSEGRHVLTSFVPSVSAPQTLAVTLVAGDRKLGEDQLELAPVRHWELHIVHQTHLDIGYTHTQEDVLELQVEWLRRAMDYIDASRDFPDEARFTWHPEGMWAVDEFMRTADAAQRERFIGHCRAQRIHLDALYAQAMSGMYTEEELMELMGAAKRFEREHGAPVTSAMQSDVPGYTWGLATALAHCGVTAMSVGPNGGHRVGHTFQWGDRPFWWVDPSGLHRVLFYMCGSGYFGLRDAEEPAIFQVLQRLEQKGYPHDLAMVRMLTGGDNAPPNPRLSEQVRAWNEKYAWPRLVISRNSGFLDAFAKRHGGEIPVVRGDFTPYWEDGSASTAKATGANRRACERIAQAQILWSMHAPALKLHERFDAAWNKMVMYDEHTWGAHNSISAPDDDFAASQDRFKQAYAFDGARLTEELLETIAPPAAAATTAVDVHNTAAWPRGGLVLLDRGQSAAGDLVRDDAGRAVVSQRLASGELAFLAAGVPAFGTRRHTVGAGSPPAGGAARADGLRLSNGLLEVAVDPQSGAVCSLRRRDAEADWVDTEAGRGLNDYLYILGRNPAEGRGTVGGPVTVTVEDGGPLVATLRIESDAPGCARLVRRVRLVDGADHLELVNTADKLKERKPEGVYFGFPFALPGATARVDVPWAVVEVEADQMPGANRNFYCVQRFVDLATAERGVTWVSVDAPLVQFDPIVIAPANGTAAFRTFIDPPPHLWSWTMNNHWETNYKADQEGEITFRYVLRPYTGGYDPVAAQRFGRDVCQPLLATAADPASPPGGPLLELAGDPGIVVTSVRPSRDDAAWIVRLFNVAPQPATTSLTWHQPVGATSVSNPLEDQLKPAPGSHTLTPFEVRTLRVERAATGAGRR